MVAGIKAGCFKSKRQMPVAALVEKFQWKVCQDHGTTRCSCSNLMGQDHFELDAKCMVVIYVLHSEKNPSLENNLFLSVNLLNLYFSNIFSFCIK